MTDRELLARIAASPSQKAGYKQLVRELSLPGGRGRRLLLEQLDRLTVRGQLVHTDREHWSVPRAARSAPRRLRLRPSQSQTLRNGFENSSCRAGHLYSTKRDQRSHAGRS